MHEGDYLRILTPEINRRGEIYYVDGRQVIKETTAPLAARKAFEDENKQFDIAGRPELKHQIELVRSNPIAESFARPVAPAFQTDIKPVKPAKAAPAKAPVQIAKDDIFE